MDQAANLRALCGASSPQSGGDTAAPLSAPEPAAGAAAAGSAHGGAELASPAASEHARVIAVTSGKGGVGKSTLTAALGAVLTRAGQRVLCLDGDIGMANLDIVLRVQPPVTLGDVVAGRVPLHRAVIPTPLGPDLLAGISGLPAWAQDPQVQALWEQTRSLADLYDVVLIDTGAGCAPCVLDFVRAADEVLLVTTPDRAAVNDAGVLLKTLAAGACPPIRAVVNEVETDTEFHRVQSSLLAAGHLFGLQLQVTGKVQRDRSVQQSARDRQPFWRDSAPGPAMRDIELVARELFGTPAPRRGGFWQRLRKIWSAALLAP